jgi:hypothetical protein
MASEGEEGGGRSKRRCVLRRAAVPSAAHYVGYVEDGETPEMIMRKFEEMERILAARQPAAAAAGGGGASGSQRPRGSSAGEQRAQQQGSEAPQLAEQPDSSPGGGLEEEQLHEIFKATSIFNVRSVLGGNEALMARRDGRPGGSGGGGAGRGGSGEGRPAWSDGERCSGGWCWRSVPVRQGRESGAACSRCGMAASVLSAQSK